MSVEALSEELDRDDYTAVDKVLRKIEKETTRHGSLESLANWKLGFKLYREVELQFERAQNRIPYQDAHRALLTSFMALTEVLRLKVEKIDDNDLARISLSKEAFNACARYMRQKYNQWFAPIDSSVTRLFETRMAEQ